MNFANYTFLALQTKSSETWRRRHEKSRDEGTHNIKIVKFCETLISYNSLKEHSPALLLYGTLQTKQQPAQGYIWEEAYFYSLFEYVIFYKLMWTFECYVNSKYYSQYEKPKIIHRMDWFIWNSCNVLNSEFGPKHSPGNKQRTSCLDRRS